MRLFSNIFLFLVSLLILATCQSGEKITIFTQQDSKREAYGVEKLKSVLSENGYAVTVTSDTTGIRNRIIIIRPLSEGTLSSTDPEKQIAVPISDEGFIIDSKAKNITISANGSSGILYGCLELAERVKAQKELPDLIHVEDQPEMVMRGTCIGLQKTSYLPGRTVYEYPYTPESFPWFYDRELWIKYLDMMVENRYNSLYLWNGHPFASLVKLKDYPYAVEVDDETFKKNEEIFAFLTEEADKRGIWVIQMFYNIIVSKPFAEENGIKTQERSRPITPLIADYTQKSIAAFIEKYPHVGLLVTLGEAMNTIDDDVEWFTKTIIPGVKDGLDSLGITEEPPIVLRGHDTDAKRVMEAALPLYRNLYTMYKYNGESLTTYRPRNSWDSIPTALSRLGSVHISNVHILANLEPFRYGDPNFIQKSVIAMHERQGANGLHLYPQASYWDWPYTADKTEPRLLEMDRDWIWYKAWARYAWNSERDSLKEAMYWSDQLSGFYGSGGEDILQAYEETGEIAPKLLRTFGISDGNRQTLLLGMFMGQLVNPFKYNVYQSFLNSNGPEGEILVDYARKEWEREPHIGETPPQIAREVVEHGEKAVKAIDKAELTVTKNKAEFERLKNDVYCYQAIANCFAEKEKAAELVLRYKYSNEVSDLDKALPHLEKSLDFYRNLVKLTENGYLYANSMQTAQRRIPITGRDGTNKTWKELLPHYEAELDNFKRNLQMLKSKGEKGKTFEVLQPLKVVILTAGVQRYPLVPGEQVFSDNRAKIKAVAPELKNLSGVQFPDNGQRQNGTVLKFKTDQPVKILVGYFNTNSYTTLRPPTLETNAQANDRGQADIKIANALDIPGLYPVNIYTYKYDAGEHELVLGKGRVLVLGFIDGNATIPIHDAGIGAEDGASVDWLFY
ncbi:hypothetical protein ACE1ET_18530 [Saccharicrinis sp. FJH62]|uniref:alpha-d-galacturonidase n=1 Tax=Saccharicrinis sp. FJH62 TaxID=3344657 RepID=UPI0035D46B37